nr:uncharacterized protein LOC123761346 isoform X1 [Procambarus clarkii]
MSVYACVYVMHTAGVLWCSWLVTASIRVQALRLPSGCKIQELGGRAEDFTVSYPLISTLNVLLKSPSNPWRAFSFGFETRSGSTIGALTFTNEDTVALTLNNRRDDEDEVVNLSRAESLHLRLETWTLLSLSVRDGKLTVAVKDVLQVVFHLVDATPFERVFTHVLLGNYIDVGMDCAQECSWILLNGTDVEDWSPSFPLSEVHKIALRHPVADWQEFSFGFELSDTTPVAFLKFQKSGESAVLTLKSITNSEGASGFQREQQVRLPEEESRQLSLKNWTFISFAVNDGRLEVEIDDADAVRFDQVDATHFYQVYVHVSRGHLVDVSFNCFTAEGEVTYPAVREIIYTTNGKMTATSAPIGGTDDPPLSGDISVGTTITVVIILLVLFAAKAGLWYRRRRLNRRKDEEVPGDVNVERPKPAEMKPLMSTQGAAEALHGGQVVTQGAAEALHGGQVVTQGAAEALHGGQVVTQGAAEALHGGQVVTQGAAEALHGDQVVTQGAAEALHGGQVDTQGAAEALHGGQVDTQGAAEALHGGQVVTQGAAEPEHGGQDVKPSTVAVAHGEQETIHDIKTILQDGVVKDTDERQSIVPGTMTGDMHENSNTDATTQSAESPTNNKITDQRLILSMIDIATPQTQNNGIEECRTDSPVDTILMGAENRGVEESCQKVEDVDIVNNTCYYDEVGVEPTEEIIMKITGLMLDDNTEENTISRLCMVTSSNQTDTESLTCTPGGRQQSQALEVKYKDAQDLMQSSSTETNILRVNTTAKTNTADNVSIDQNLMATLPSTAKSSDTEHSPQPPGVVRDVPRDAASDKADEERRRENAEEEHSAQELRASTNDSGACVSTAGVSRRNTSTPRMPQDEELHSVESWLSIQKYQESGLASEYPQSDSQLKIKKAKTNRNKIIAYDDSRVRKNTSHRRPPPYL